MKKLVLLFSSSLFLLSFSFSQEILWQRTIGGSSVEQECSALPTTDGGYIVGGLSGSDISGEKTENGQGSYDYWVLKLDASGSIQWQNNIGGFDADGFENLQQTSDGGYILVGPSNSDSTGDKTENHIGPSQNLDYWVVKLDASGNIQWQNTIGGNNDDFPQSVVQSNDGGFLIGGFSQSNISGDKTENSRGGDDYWIVKLDSNGIVQWDKTIGGSNLDELSFNSIQQTPDGGYILGGISFSSISGDKTENNWGPGGSGDYWIVKINSVGSIEWQNTIGGTDDDALISIRLTSDHGYILGGESTSIISGDKTESCLGTYDYWVVKLDSVGNIQWQNTIGGSNIDRLRCVEQTIDGGYILGGYSQSNSSFDKSEDSKGYWDYWIVKLDNTGIIQWDKTIGGVGHDELFSIRQINNEDYIIGGTSKSNISGDKSENSRGFGDYWVIKLSEHSNKITGKLFCDLNSNQMQDAGEPPVTNKQISELTSGRFSFSQSTGKYYVTVLDSGNFTVESGLNYYNAVPSANAAYFSGFNQVDSLNDFAFQPTGIYNDLCVTITPVGNFYGGANSNYIINYENVGTTTVDGTLIFFPDSNVTFLYSIFNPTYQTPDSIVWDIGTLTPFQTGRVIVTVYVHGGINIGSLINSNARIEPIAGDANTACNYAASQIVVTGSYDPNAILVDKEVVLTTELSNPPYLDYIIYFQNTGNDTAFNIRVLNNLPQQLDELSFEFVASSHPMNITYGANARLMTFTFDNLNLPDSNINEPASHGFVRYRIKPKTTLAAGDSILNTAFIYFDFNDPVQTDTAITRIVLPTGIEEAAVNGSKQLKIYPNPATQTVTVSGFDNSLKSLKLFDVYGRVAFFNLYQTTSNQTIIDISNLNAGVYFIKAGNTVGKFVKE